MRWPNPETVLAAAQQWAEHLASREPSIVAVGCFGSYARDEAGVGSDLDLIVIMSDNGTSQRREGAWAVEQLPIPADVIVYTANQWGELSVNGPRFFQTLQYEARWLFGAPPGRV